jgi:hypothetical protein
MITVAYNKKGAATRSEELRCCTLIYDHEIRRGWKLLKR